VEELMVEVTQEDIAAAKAAQVDMLIGGAQGNKEVWLKVEQSYTNHRIASTTTLQAELAEARATIDSLIVLAETALDCGQSVDPRDILALAGKETP
jgi:apolipoprotein N-acyltransferase